MLDYQTQMNRAYYKAKEELERMDYTKIDYPSKATADNWDVTVSDDILPKLEGTLYFIYDSEQTLLYIGKSKKIDAALRSHLVRKTSKSTSSILDHLKVLISKSKNKCVYVKVLAVEPAEFSACLKPIFVREYQPLWVRRMN